MKYLLIHIQIKTKVPYKEEVNLSIKKEVKKRQHYVPQFYLKMHSGSNRVNCYDKTLHIKRPNTLTEKIGYEKYFYNFSEEFVKEVKEHDTLISGLVKKHIDPNFIVEEFDKQFLEDYFSVLESKMALSFSSFVTKIQGKSDLLNSSITDLLSVSEKQDIAKFIALQSIRVPSFRELGEKVRNLLRLTLPDPFDKLFEESAIVGDNERLFLHLCTGSLQRLGDYFLENFNWSLAVINKPEEARFAHVRKTHVTTEFLLSDNPVINIKNMIEKHENGISLEFALPINSKLLLLLRESNYPYSTSPNSIFSADRNLVRIYNDFQVRFSNRKIFYNDEESFKKLQKFFKSAPRSYTHNADTFAVMPL